MPSFCEKPFKLTNTVAPSVFVMRDGTADNAIKLALIGAPCIGIATNAMKSTPGLTGSDNAIAGIAGDYIMIYGAGSTCQVKAGGTFTAGTFVKPDASGFAVTCTGGDLASAIANQAAISGQLVLVDVLPEGTVCPTGYIVA